MSTGIRNQSESVLLPPERPFGCVAEDRPAKDVGDRHEEIHVVARELDFSGAMRANDSPRSPLGTGDGAAHPADDLMVEEEGRTVKPALRSQVVDHNRLTRVEREAGLGIHPRSHSGLADEPFLPPDARPQQQPIALRKQFENLAVLIVQDLGYDLDATIE